MKELAFAQTEAPESQQPETPRIQKTEKREAPVGNYEVRSRELLKASRELDQELAFVMGGDLMEKTEMLQTLDVLANAKELDRETLGDDDAGVNAITRRTFDHPDGAVVAYVKPRSGEASYRYDADTNRVFKQTYVFNEKRNAMELNEELAADAQSTGKEEKILFAHFSEWQQKLPALKEQLGKRYGIPPEQVPLSEEGGMREGVEASESATREYFASRMDQLLGFNVVPLTALRAEANGKDISSAQEAFLPQDPNVPVQPMSVQLFFEMKAKGKEHPGAKSLMRIACLDYLLNHSDRHPYNVLYDPTSKQFKAIDNGLSMGLSTARYDQGADGKEKRKVIPLDRSISVPMDVVESQQDWELDEEIVDRLRAFYDSALQYEEFKQNMKPDEARFKESLGGEYKYFTKLFRTLYRNENVAAGEGIEFLKRLKHLVDHRRPSFDGVRRSFAANFEEMREAAEAAKAAVEGKTDIAA